MKHLSLILIVIFVASMISSCGSSPYKKRRGCHGKGSWYGKRNLGFNHKFELKERKSKTYYVSSTKENVEEDI